MEPIINNKVAESGIVTLNLEQYLPSEKILSIDLKDFLFMGMVVKEKDFRAQLLSTDWNKFQNSLVAVYCSTDAIIAPWAFALVSTYLAEKARRVFMGTPQDFLNQLIFEEIEHINLNLFVDKRVVLKGCGDINIPVAAYLYTANKLTPVVKSLMYGEPCSTVPLYKKSIK